MKRLTLSLFAIPVVLCAQTTINGGRIIKGILDASGSTRTLPQRTGTGSPVGRDNCESPGEIYFQTDATAGQNLWACTAAGTPGTWFQIGGGGTSGSEFAPVSTVVLFSATPTFTASGSIQIFNLTLTGNVTSSTLSGAAANSILIFDICQNATGGWTFAWPTGFSAAGAVSTTASSCSSQIFVWTGSTANPVTPVTSNLAYVNASQTFTGTNTFTGTVNNSGAAHTLPAQVGTSASKPATCTQGEMYFATDATAGQNWYYCTATNTWTAQAAGGSGAVSSVFGRTGAVTAQSGDYTAAQVGALADPGANGILMRTAADTTAIATAASFPTLNQSTTGNAATASALAATPAQCSTNQFATGITAAGTANCVQPTFANLSGTATATQIPAALSGTTSVNGTTIPASSTLLTTAGGNAVSASTATDIASGSAGSIPYQSAAGTTAMLSGNSAATDQVLVSHGTGSAAQAPTLSNAPALSAANMTGFPTLNQNTTGSAASFTGSLAGDVTGTENATTVARVNGVTVGGAPSSSGQVLTATSTSAASWQTPATSGNASVTPTTVTYSATPTFTRSSNIQEFTLTLAGNVTSSTLSGAAAGDLLTFDICQNSTGGWTMIFPTGFTQAPAVDTNPSVCTHFSGIWDGSNFQLSGGATTTEIPFLLSGAAERSAPTTAPAAGFASLWPDGGRHTWASMDNASTNKHIMPRTAGSTDQLASTDLSDSSSLARASTGSFAVGDCVEVSATSPVTFADNGSPCGTGSGSGANANGYYLVTQSTNEPANAMNLGALSSGVLVQTVSSGVATPAIATSSSTFPGSAAAVGGVTVTGTPSSGQVLTATSGTAASWSTPSSSGGTVTYTGNHTMGTADNGLLVQMNCSAACTVTLPNPQPSSTWSARIISINTANVPTVALGSSMTFNGGTSVPVLNAYRALLVEADSATSTNYAGDAPLVAGTNVTLTPAANGITIASSGGGSMTYPSAGVANSTGSAWGTSYTVGASANNLVQLNSNAQLPAVSGALLTGLTASQVTNAVASNATNTATSAMTLDMSAAAGSAAFKVPVQAGGTSSANGAIIYDSTNKNTHIRANGADAIAAAFASTPNSGDCVNVSVSSGAILLGDAGSPCGSGSGGAVSSVFGRTGAVVAATGDYSFSQVSGSATTSQLPGTGVTTIAGQSCTIGSSCSIASTNLSDTSSIAYLASNETFSGNVTHSGTLTSTGTVNNTGATHTMAVKTGSSTPSTCTQGELFFSTAATAGQNLYFCTATNTWTQMSGGGSSTVTENIFIPFAGQYSTSNSYTGGPGIIQATGNNSSTGPSFAHAAGYGFPYMAFNDDTSGGPETIYATAVLHQNWTGTLNAMLVGASGSNSGNAYMLVSTACAPSGTNLETVSFNTTSTGTISMSGTAGVISYLTLSSINVTGCNAGNLIAIKVQRDHTNSSDTLAAVADIIGIQLQWQHT
jgi:hypothetical protein